MLKPLTRRNVTRKQQFFQFILGRGYKTLILLLIIKTVTNEHKYNTTEILLGYYCKSL